MSHAVFGAPQPLQPPRHRSWAARALGLDDPGLALLASLALLVILACWSLQAGHNQADSVEYAEKASQWVARGYMPSNQRSVRGPLLPLLLSPPFALAKALGVTDTRFVWPLLRGFQVLISLAFVIATARLGERLAAGARRSPPRLEAGRRMAPAGLVAGFLVVCNPIFLRFSADPIAGLLAGVLVALGLAQLLAPLSGTVPDTGSGTRATGHRARVGFAAGLLLGLAGITAYKALPLALALFGMSLLRDRWHGRARWLGWLAGFACALAIGIALDRIAYGVWGLSLANYLAYNVTVTGVPLLLALGLHGAATRLYEIGNLYYGFKGPVETESVIQHVAQHPPQTWYLTHADEFLGLPGLTIIAIALIVCVRRPRWATTIVLGGVLAFGVVLSAKHSKAYRLWLPALPLIAALCGWSWELLWGARSDARLILRRGLCALLLVTAPLFGLAEYLRLGPRLHENFWQAVAWIDEVRRSEGVQQATYASSHPFATILRTPPELQLVRLEHPLQELSMIVNPTEKTFARHLRDLESVDWLLIPERTLRANAGLRARLSERFTIATAFFEPDKHERLWGPLYVLRRAPHRAAGDPSGAALGAARGRRFFTRTPLANPDEFEHSQGKPPWLRSFSLEMPDAGPQTMRLVAVEFEELPDSGLGWLSSTWEAPAVLAVDCLLRLRVETPAGAPLELVDMVPGYDRYPTSSWTGPARLTEGRLVGLTNARLDENEGWARVWSAVLATTPAGRRIGPFAPVLDPRLQLPKTKDGWTQVMRIVSPSLIP